MASLLRLLAIRNSLRLAGHHPKGSIESRRPLLRTLSISTVRPYPACILERTDAFCIIQSGDGHPGKKGDGQCTASKVTCPPTSDYRDQRRRDPVRGYKVGARSLGRGDSRSLSRDITLASETLQLDQFKHMIKQPKFREWRGVLRVDEAHLTYKWGVDFRVSYGDIGQ
ncbi:hypothetical protein FIBSPDRAFT_956772 [Athelia psychrophila]|uniref:Uncharacterized protein n=1 Tax=Athelia psychrophila TaxID=1759441 RepID=A0A166GH04_9AGAM|nr:hypothetical protein FIBSPDRAFT_956772 [Fibularhizoctonia sp. CBS 109695]